MINSNVTPTGDLANAEHAEASQQTMNERKAALRDAMSPEERARHDLIEQAVQLLEQARVPFLLYADSTPEELSLKQCCFWQFNKLGYEADWDTMVDNSQFRRKCLVETEMKTLSRSAHGTFVWYSADGKPRLIAKGAQVQWIEAAPDAEGDGDAEKATE